MKKLLLPIVLIVLAIAGTGCATGPTHRSVKDTFPPLAAEKGRIFLYRTTTMGAVLQPDIKVNGDVIGESKAKGFIFRDFAPGNYEIMTSTEVDRKLTFALDAGQIRYVKLGVSMGFLVGHVYPELVDNAIGEKEIAGCKYME